MINEKIAVWRTYMNKYDGLGQYLKNKNTNIVEISFKEIEERINDKLPNSFYLYTACWSTYSSHFGRVILSYGYKTRVNINNQKVTFIKESSVIEIKTTKLSTNTQKGLKRNIEIPADLFDYFSNFEQPYFNDENSRYRSYDHLRRAFIKYRKDNTKKDYLALMLYTYLASWGMLRNSFLMQKDYKFNYGIIDILCDEKYDSLINIDCFNIKETDIKVLTDLIESIRNFYIGCKFFEGHNLKKISSVTDTLISKIVLGTFGCLIAYDRYVKRTLKALKIPTKLGVKSIKLLFEFIKENKQQLTLLNSKFDRDLYTTVKIVDMVFFEYGQANLNN